MNTKNNKGVTMVDITIAIGIIFLFSSLITGLIYNYSNSTKSIQRKTEATNQAVNIIEALKTIDYYKINQELPTDISVGEVVENNGISIKKEEENLYKFDVETLKAISEKDNGNTIELELLQGYSAEIQLEKYADRDGNKNKEDAIIIATVTVTYKVGNQDQDVELTTLLVKEKS